MLMELPPDTCIRDPEELNLQVSVPYVNLFQFTITYASANDAVEDIYEICRYRNHTLLLDEPPAPCTYFVLAGETPYDDDFELLATAKLDCVHSFPWRYFDFTLHADWITTSIVTERIKDYIACMFRRTQCRTKRNR